MATITLASNATPAMASVLPKFVTPADIAKEASVFSIMSPEYVTGDAAVTAVRNLGTGAGQFEQSISGREPSLAADVDLGRQTLAFDSSKSQYMRYSNDVDYTGAWSLLTVFKVAAAAPSATYTFLGNEAAPVSNRACVQLAATNIRARAGDIHTSIPGFSGQGQWYAAIGSFDGSDRVSVWLSGEDVSSNTGLTTPPTGTTDLFLGDNESAFGMYGSIDMAARFELDVLDSSNAAIFDDIRNMLARYYGSRITGLS